MDLQLRAAPASRRCRRTPIRRHFHNAHELSRIRIQTNKHPPQRRSFEARVVSQAAVPFARAQYHNFKLQRQTSRSPIDHIKRIPMTLIQTPCEEKVEKMDGSKQDSEKCMRPVRNRRYTRRCLVAGQRPQKRLFTPEIKRYLKDWLVRRRDNPYPNREEKKNLSRETGLTYIQICNWFANWRRKLKNVNADRNQLTWGHLIRTYNDRAQGNVEQFSICSDDSIWSEPEPTSPNQEPLDESFEHSPNSEIIYKQEDSDGLSSSLDKFESFNNNSNEIERCDKPNCNTKAITSPVLLSKWLESAARFQPSEANYAWWAEGRRKKQETKTQPKGINTVRHDRDEVEAAVALTALATATSRVTAP